MVAIKRGGTETMEDFMHRFNTRILDLKRMHAFTDWDVLYHRRFFNWAGHIARMQQYAPERVTSRVLRHKCWQQIQAIASANRGNQLHGRRLKCWRWERLLYTYFAESHWMAVALDRSNWNSHLEGFSTWRCGAG
eukprot:9337114-Karenia_brevis.AAC.1